MVMTLNKNWCDYRQEAVLLNGQKIIIRAIRSEDRKALVEFHKYLSDNTRFLRYQYLKGELTESDLMNFCDVDYITIPIENKFSCRAEFRMPTLRFDKETFFHIIASTI